MTTAEMWRYQRGVGATDVTGYDVEAVDGGIGKVDESTNDVDHSYIVVDTGAWIFGKKVLLPASVIDRVDATAEKVYVNRSKDEIKNAPEFDEKEYRDDAYRRRVGDYYGRSEASFRG